MNKTVSYALQADGQVIYVSNDTSVCFPAAFASTDTVCHGTTKLPQHHSLLHILHEICKSHHTMAMTS